MATCDKCSNDAMWMRGNMLTGDQAQLCDNHLANDAPAPALDPLAVVVDPAVGIPDTCEVCGVEPLAIVWQRPDGSGRQFLGGMCALVIGRAGYLSADAELRERVAEGAAAILTQPKPQRKSKRADRDRVAVDEPGSEGETVDASAAQPTEVVEVPVPVTAAATSDPED